MHLQETLTIATDGPGLYEITTDVTRFVRGGGVSSGLLTLFVQHTSASVIIQENADDDVQKDLTEFFALIVPEGMEWLRHTSEGADDMPAHIKSALTSTGFSVPIAHGHMMLGTWQGIFLFEHRSGRHNRHVVLHLG